MFFIFLLVCGGIFTSLNGSITSPGYPNVNYPNNADCQYEIRVPRDRRIVLTFDEFSLQPSYDILSIKQLTSGSFVSIANLTGFENNGRKFLSAENVFILVFTSDSSSTYRGFAARYRTIESGIPMPNPTPVPVTRK